MLKANVLTTLATLFLLSALQASVHADGGILPTVSDRPDPIVQEQAFDYIGPSGGRTLVFAQFDDLGGTRFLIDVVLELLDTSTTVFHLQAQNTANVQNTVQIDLSSDIQATAPSNLVTTLALSATEAATIAPLATHDFGDMSDIGSSSSNLVARPNPDFAPYIGTGSINIAVQNVAGLQVTCSVPDCGSTVILSSDQWRIVSRLRLSYVYVESPTDVEPPQTGSRVFTLSAPRPNPAIGASVCYFPVHAPRSGPVEIELYAVGGRLVARGPRTWLSTGDHLLAWMPPSLVSGNYIVRLRTPEGAASTSRLTVVR